MWAYGECDEGAMCPHAVWVALATNRMGTLRTPSEAMSTNCVADDNGWTMVKRQDGNGGRIGAILPSR